MNNSIFFSTKHCDSPTYITQDWQHIVSPKQFSCCVQPSPINHLFRTLSSLHQQLDILAKKFCLRKRKHTVVIMYYSRVQKVSLVMRHLLVMVVDLSVDCSSVLNADGKLWENEWAFRSKFRLKMRVELWKVTTVWSETLEIDRIAFLWLRFMVVLEVCSLL